MEASNTTTSHSCPSTPAVLSPCAACKILRRRCDNMCMLAPYFPPNEPHKFMSAHRVFGASNIIKLLQEIPERQRADAVSSMVYEAEARIRDPVYGSTGVVCHLQQQVCKLQAQLARAQAELVSMQTLNHSLDFACPPQPVDKFVANTSQMLQPQLEEASWLLNYGSSEGSTSILEM